MHFEVPDPIARTIRELRKESAKYRIQRNDTAMRLHGSALSWLSSRPRSADEEVQDVRRPRHLRAAVPRLPRPSLGPEDSPTRTSHSVVRDSRCYGCGRSYGCPDWCRNGWNR